MSQVEKQEEIDLVDIIHFFVERWRRMFVIVLVVFSLVFGGVVAKKMIAQNSSVVDSEIASDATGIGKAYKAVALIELAQILGPRGYAKPIAPIDVLIATYQNDRVKLDMLAENVSGNPPNSFWLTAEGESGIDAEKIVKKIAEKIINIIHEKELIAKQNKRKQYSVIGTTHIAKYELIEPEEEPEEEIVTVVKSVFEIKMLFKIALFSLLFGVFASLLYVAIEKVQLDYRKKYPT